MKRLFIITLVTFIVGGAGLWSYVTWKTRGAPHIAVTGGRILSIRLPAEAAHFRQNDLRWGHEKLGLTTETIKAVGCAMCSVASAAQYLGETTDPSTLNRALIENEGYTEQGWLVWSAIAKIFNKRIEVNVLSSPSHEAMDQALEAGQYSVVKFFLPMGIPHWVIVVGKEGQDYLIYDPTQSKKEPVPLSEKTAAIYSLRIVRRGV